MLHRLILKVNKFQLPPSQRLATVVQNSLGDIIPPMSNRVKDRNRQSLGEEVSSSHIEDS